MPQHSISAVKRAVAGPTIKKRTDHSATKKMMEAVEVWDNIVHVFARGGLMGLSVLVKWKGKKLEVKDWATNLISRKNELSPKKFCDAFGIAKHYGCFRRYAHPDPTQRIPIAKLGRPRRKKISNEARIAAAVQDNEAREAVFGIDIEHGIPSAMLDDNGKIPDDYLTLNRLLDMKEDRLTAQQTVELFALTKPNLNSKAWREKWVKQLRRMAEVRPAGASDYVIAECQLLDECDKTFGNYRVRYIGPTNWNEPCDATNKRRNKLSTRIERFRLEQIRLSLTLASPGAPSLLLALDSLVEKLDDIYTKAGLPPTDLRKKLKEYDHESYCERKRTERKQKKPNDNYEETIEALTLKELYRRRIRDIKKQMADLEAKLDAEIDEEDSYLMAAPIVRAE